MTRPLRVQFPGATYHVTARGDRQEPIYRDDQDRRTHLAVLAHAMDRFDACVLAYCLMGNHFHLVLHTRQPNLSRLMRHVNGVYTQRFNRRHGVVGHLLQGRFKAIVVDSDSYLLALCRYVERNPVAAGLVAPPSDWAWSSCRAHIGRAATPPWLDCAALYRQLLGHAIGGHSDVRRATLAYCALVGQPQPQDETFWVRSLRAQVFLGDDDFIRRAQHHAVPALLADKQLPRQQRSRPLTWDQCLASCAGDLAQALHLAYREAGMTMTALACQTGYSISHISRLLAQGERRRVPAKWQT